MLLAAMALASSSAVPRAVSISPAARSIPANTLRLYIIFDRPARGIVTMRDIRLLDAAGRTIDGAFMDFGQELWSPDGRRLTVLFDPGRVKRDVEGNDDSAAPLQVGQSFTVDISGRRFRYEVTPAVRTAIAPGAWRLTLPKMGSREPLTVTFDREMDDALQRDQLEVADARGRAQPGLGTPSVEGRVWSWRPKDRWRAGAYQLVVGGNLEDVSGNRVGEALDHEAGSPDHPSQTVAVPFTVGRRVDPAPRLVGREAMNEIAD